MAPKITLELDKETAKSLEEMRALLSVGELGHSAGMVADLIAARARELAPEGPTGNLKRGIVARVDKTARTLGIGAATVGANYKIAPHAHLVEYGTSGRRFPKKKDKLVFYIDGEKFVLDSVAPMPAHPFMRPAIEQLTPEIGPLIDADLQNRIDSKMGK